MNRPIRKVTIALAVLFLALFVNLNVVQVVRGASYRDNGRNARVLLNEYSTPRGQIVVQGTNVAESKVTKDELKYLRVYPNGPVYAPATGFYSYTYGNPYGVESTENDILSGNSSSLFTSNLGSLLTGRTPTGGSVQLTLNRAAQKAAYQAMRSADGTMRRGAVVAIDPKTGAILAMVSTPSYDPNALSSHNPNTIAQAYHCYSALPNLPQRRNESNRAFAIRYHAMVRAQIDAREHGSTKPGLTDFGAKGCGNVPDDPTSTFAGDPSDPGPLLNRAVSQTYPPGSTFKIIDSAAALKKGVQASTSIPAPDSFWPLDPSRTSRCPPALNQPCVENFDGEQCDNGKTATLAFAFAKSCNTAFAELAVQKIGASDLSAQARQFGLDKNPPQVLPNTATSTIGSTAELGDKAALAQIAFGQRSVRVSPLQGAMMAAAVANNGTLMKPYLVQLERRSDQSVLHQTRPSQLSSVLEPDLDQDLIKMMEQVVSSPEGTGGPAAITSLGPSVVVGGKTGTADVGTTSASKLNPDAWFNGFALVKGDPRIAVAAIIENGGVAGNETTGGLAAGPVAKKVMTAYLKSTGVS